MQTKFNIGEIKYFFHKDDCYPFEIDVIETDRGGTVYKGYKGLATQVDRRYLNIEEALLFDTYNECLEGAINRTRDNLLMLGALREKASASG
jgi:lipoate-protein ligase B